MLKSYEIIDIHPMDAYYDTGQYLIGMTCTSTDIPLEQDEDGYWRGLVEVQGDGSRFFVRVGLEEVEL